MMNAICQILFTLLFNADCVLIVVSHIGRAHKMRDPIKATARAQNLFGVREQNKCRVFDMIFDQSLPLSFSIYLR